MFDYDEDEDFREMDLLLELEEVYCDTFEETPLPEDEDDSLVDAYDQYEYLLDHAE